MPNGSASRSDTEIRVDRDQAIQEFAAAHLKGENQDLYEDMLLTICRLARDGCTRGDVKLLHKALAELRYGFRVFAPYRETRKISIFGSSRAAVLSVILFFICGGLVLTRVNVAEGEARAREVSAA